MTHDVRILRGRMLRRIRSVVTHLLAHPAGSGGRLPRVDMVRERPRRYLRRYLRGRLGPRRTGGRADHGSAVRNVGDDDGVGADGGAIANVDIAEDARACADGDIIADAREGLHGAHADGDAVDKVAVAAERDGHDDGPDGMGDVESGADRHAGDDIQPIAAQVHTRDHAGQEGKMAAMRGVAQAIPDSGAQPDVSPLQTQDIAQLDGLFRFVEAEIAEPLPLAGVFPDQSSYSHEGRLTLPEIQREPDSYGLRWA